MNKTLAIGNIAGTTVGVLSWIANAGDVIIAILSIVSVVVGAACGIWQLVNMIQDTIKDKKITEAEKKAIVDKVDEITEELKERLNNGNKEESGTDEKVDD